MHKYFKLTRKHFYYIFAASISALLLVLLSGSCMSVLAVSKIEKGHPLSKISASYVIPNAFLGEWYSHGAFLSVTQDGHAKFSARAYSWCGPEVAQPCDSWQGDTIIDGIQQDFSIVRVQGNTAYGKITVSTTHDVGKQITITLGPDDTLRLNTNNTLCGPQAPIGYCGA